MNNGDGYSPTISPWNGGPSWLQVSDVDTTAPSVINLGGQVPSHQSLTNPLVFPQFNSSTTPWLQGKVTQSQRFSNLRA